MGPPANATIALVSGANRGIGREISRQLADSGVHVLVGGRDERAAVEAADELSDGGRLSLAGVQLDVTDDDSVARVAERIAGDPGRLDVLLNNAGVIGGGYEDRVATVDLDRVRSTLDTNLFGAWRLAQALLPLLRESPHARIVNVSTGMGQLSDMGGGAPAYRVSKTALNALTRILAAEEPGILVNAMCPGWVATDMGGESAPTSVEDGADTGFWLATLPDDGPTGGFFRKRAPIPW
jgi:NAD(P)-dependent dehydrogenase (short-subunit alcohol dehydrogenase family)